METKELVVSDPEVLKAEIVEYLGSVIDDARQYALEVKDDATAERAVALGALVKGKIAWLKEKRKEVYEPLYRATERVREQYDAPLKLGTAIEKTLSAAVIEYRLKVKRQEERKRLEAEAEARRVREEAERKEREAQAARAKLEREQREAEERRRLEAAAEERRKREEEERRIKEEQERAQREQDARARQIQEEENARLKTAQEAHDVGLADRREAILETPTPVAPLPTPLPTAAELAEAEAKRKQEEAAEARRRQELEAQRQAEEARLKAEAEKLRQMEEDAAKAKAQAAVAEAAADASISVVKKDERLNTTKRYKYDVPNAEAFKKLCRAVAEDRAPVEYAGYDAANPAAFRSAALTKDVQRYKHELPWEKIGVRVWVEESGSFKA